MAFLVKNALYWIHWSLTLSVMVELVMGLVEVEKYSVPEQAVGPHQLVQVPGEPLESGAVRTCKYTPEVPGVSAVH